MFVIYQLFDGICGSLRSRCKNLALIATITVDKAISAAPAAGLRTIFKLYNTPAARGIAITL